MRNLSAALVVTTLAAVTTAPLAMALPVGRAPMPFQNSGQASAPFSQQNGRVPLYKAALVHWQIPAMSYVDQQKAKIALAGTGILPGIAGQAQVRPDHGQISIRIKISGFVPAYSFGPEYLTYVLWAVTPSGRAVNLGELMPDNKGRCNLTVTTTLQSFGLMVSAEPYFSVATPSNVVVLENQVIPGQTNGIIDAGQAHFTLLPRGAYAAAEGMHPVSFPIGSSNSQPLAIYEAMNAIDIAKASEAELYAPDALKRAQNDLKQAESLNGGRNQRAAQLSYARAAVQTAADARMMAEQKARAAEEARQKAAELAAQQKAQQALATAQQASAAQKVAEQQAQQAQQAQQQSEQAQAAAEAAAAQAQQQAAAAKAETNQMRGRLRQQLNQVLSTQETARGLIVRLSDVGFNSGSYQLKVGAEIKLAKIAGILVTYPGLKVQVEGYTDNVGSAPYNLKLSQQRADAVMQFLVTQGVSSTNITSKGYGEADPVAENSTAAGRAKNRRVQLVVSGSVIGTGIQQGPPQPPPAPANPTGVSNPTGISNVGGS